MGLTFQTRQHSRRFRVFESILSVKYFLVILDPCESTRGPRNTSLRKPDSLHQIEEQLSITRGSYSVVNSTFGLFTFLSQPRNLAYDPGITCHLFCSVGAVAILADPPEPPTPHSCSKSLNRPASPSKGAHFAFPREVGTTRQGELVECHVCGANVEIEY